MKKDTSNAIYRQDRSQERSDGNFDVKVDKRTSMVVS